MEGVVPNGADDPKIIVKANVASISVYALMQFLVRNTFKRPKKKTTQQSLSFPPLPPPTHSGFAYMKNKTSYPFTTCKSLLFLSPRSLSTNDFTVMLSLCLSTASE